MSGTGTFLLLSSSKARHPFGVGRRFFNLISIPKSEESRKYVPDIINRL
jgi:hypothetical protein